MGDPRVTHHGKQVMFDGEHLADARDDEAAEIIALALIWAVVSDLDTPRDIRVKFEDFLA